MRRDATLSLAASECYLHNIEQRLICCKSPAKLVQLFYFSFIADVRTPAIKLFYFTFILLLF